MEIKRLFNIQETTVPVDPVMTYKRFGEQKAIDEDKEINQLDTEKTNLNPVKIEIEIFVKMLLEKYYFLTILEICI